MKFLPKHAKVVVPVDFSPHSRAAAEAALEFVDETQHLTLVHVLPIIAEYEAGLAAWSSINDDERRRNAERVFDEMFSEPKFNGVKSVVLFGEPGSEVAHYADQHGANLIVMPSHGYSGFKRFLLGSVAERVARLSNAHVLILKHVLKKD